VILGAALIVGCGASPPASSPTMSGDDATLTYGYAPELAAGVTYQPDVILVAGGASSIRSASGDGLVWTIDRSATGAANLVVGSVMLLTSRATGRVADIRDDGNTRVVTLSPVDLTEIVSDGTFSVDQDIDLDAMGYQLIPDLPGALGQPESIEPSPSPSALWRPTEGMAQSGTWDVVLPPLRLRAKSPAAAGGASDLPPALKPRQCAEVTVGSWSAKPCAEKGKVSLGIDYKAVSGGAGLKLGVVISLPSASLHLRTSTTISGGQAGASTLALEGLNGVDVEIAGGVANGASDNDKVKVEVPIEIDRPFPPAPNTLGLPTNLKLEFKYIIETAFSGNNSTLKASGSYGLDGPLGIDGGSFVTPTFTVLKPMLDSLSGIAIGVSGVVVAAKVKIQYGLGVPAATAGPYVTLTAAIGVTLGSALGAALAQCRGLTVDLKGGIGFGITITQDALKDLLSRLPKAIKIKTETERTWSIFHGEQVQPDVPLCRSG
jgi:hypothetical protein